MAIMMLAQTGRCIKGMMREGAKRHDPRSLMENTPSTTQSSSMRKIKHQQRLKGEASIESMQREMRQVKENDGGELQGRMIYLYSVQGGVQRNRHFT